MANDSGRPFTGHGVNKGRRSGSPAPARTPAEEGVTRICVIGAGPRGISVVERLCANAGLPYLRERRYAVHLIDPFPSGGQVWRTGQRAELLMNTVASQITLFCDESVVCVGPVVPGPSLHQWATLLEELGPGGLPADVRREAAALGPDAYPTRRLYGHYLMWVLDRLIGGAPPTSPSRSITPRPWRCATHRAAGVRRWSRWTGAARSPSWTRWSWPRATYRWNTRRASVSSAGTRGATGSSTSHRPTRPTSTSPVSGRAGRPGCWGWG